tara:strand:- start:1220 stop:2425 length:1206 start_codon:yes stop_codon:yes gene_type:complete
MSQKEKEKPVVDDTKEGLKIKKKPSLRNKTPETTKLDLSKKEKDAIQEPETTKVVLQSDEKKEEQVVGLQEVGSTHEEEKPTEETKVENKIEEKQEEVKSPISEVIKEKEVKETTKELKEAVRDEKITGKKLPENIEKLVSFMEETGGTVEDYVNLNRDYSKYDSKSLLQEYYNKTKPHLDSEEINFLMEDNFSYDEEVDEERDIRKKKLAYKEEIAKAKKFLESSKSKYYDEIKLRPGVTQEQQKALDFFNRYNKEQQIAEQRRKTFKENTSNTLNEKFEGFEFDLGEKKFKYSISNPSAVAEKQSDLNTFVKKFLNKEGEVVDTVGYHKAIYAADNADTIASHFYEQGKADAIKDMMAKSKNITNEPRPQATGDVFINGLRVKAVNGVDTSRLKIKSKK